MHSIISRNLPKTAEFIISTNVKSPVKITGVTSAQIRNSKNDPWRTGYFVFYDESGVVKKAEINQELYTALHLVFKTLSDLDSFDYHITD